MGMISGYFRRLAAIIGSNRAVPPAVVADAAGLRIGGEQVRWSEVCRVDAYKRDIYVGDLLGVVISCTDGRVLDINEESPGWQETGKAVEQFLPCSLPHAEWTLRLMAAQPGETLRIFPAT